MKQIKLLILFLLVILSHSPVYSQTDSLMKHGIGIGIGFYKYPSLYISYSKILNWPKYGDESSIGFEFIKNSKQTYLMMSGRTSFNLYKTNKGFKIGIGISGLIIPVFMYMKTDTIANFGIRPELNIGYKNLSIGYQYNYFIFQENLIGIGRQSIFIYYRLGLGK